MRSHQFLITLVLAVSLSIPNTAAAKAVAEGSRRFDFDIILRGGHLIDPKNQIDGLFDVAIKDGMIADISPNVFGSAMTEINATGLFVTPGLIDIHTHVFYGQNQFFEEGGTSLAGTRVSIEPDSFSFRTGTTTVVDAGSSGWRNFEEFKRNVIDVSATRVLAHLNIVGGGLMGNLVKEQNLADMDPITTGLMARQFEDIVGIKIAHYISPNYIPHERGIEAGIIGGVPAIVHYGPDPLPLSILLLEKFRPGDILTHMYSLEPPNGHIVNLDTNMVEDYAFMARERGVIFDVGNGAGSFSWSLAVPAVKQGFVPDTISTDMHEPVDGMKDIVNVMSKFINLGVPLKDVIAMSTWQPAQAINRTELGHIGSVGDIADVSLFSLKEGKFGFVDSDNLRVEGTKKLISELTVFGGMIMHDLNGRSGTPFMGHSP